MRVPLLSLAIVPALVALGGCSSSEGSQAAHTYQMGERVYLGHLVYTVFDRQWLTQIGSGVDARVPQNRFYLVRISVVNSGGGPVILPTLSLVDDSGTAFSEQINGEGVADFLGALRQINPAASAQGNLVFDVPPKHYKLRLADEDGKDTALVELPLSFDTDTPAIPPSLDPTATNDLTKK